MSNELSNQNSQQFLPSKVKKILICWSLQLCGIFFVSAAVLLWLSLLTWSVEDPSLSTIGSIKPANLIGPFGATIADLLLQIFGLSSVVILTFLTIWGAELSVAEQVDRFRVRSILAILSLITISGSLSSIYVNSRWVFSHGYGGALGDVSYNLLASIITAWIGQTGGLTAGLSMLILGSLSFICAVGFNYGNYFKKVQSTYKKIPTCPKFNIEDESRQLLKNSSQLNFDLTNLKTSRTKVANFNKFDTNPPNPNKLLFDLGESCFDNSLKNNVNETQGLPSECERLSTRKIAQRFSPNNGLSFKFLDHTSLQLNGGISKKSDYKSRTTNRVFSSDKEKYKRNNQCPVEYQRPSLDDLQSPLALTDSNSVTDQKVELNQIAESLTLVLKDFRVKGKILNIQPGPVVTLFEFEPAPGTKSSRVISLADDIARSMSCESTRIAVIPGRNAIGIELPNEIREKVFLRDVFESQDYNNCDARLPLALGKGIDDRPVLADLTRMPHLLVAGTTGSGKSVGINAMILSLLYQKSPDDCRLLMIDPKMLELSAYNGIPHLLSPVITDPSVAVLALQWAIRQMEDRYRKMTEIGARSIEVFNNRVREANRTGTPLKQKIHVGFDQDTGETQFRDKLLNFEPMPYIVIIVDEFADLMAVAGKEVDILIKRLSQMARAAGLHLIMATQRPSVDVVTGTIKANFPTRLAYKVASKIDSRTIVNCSGAEQLLGQGDLLFANGSNSMIRAHGPFVSDDEVEAVVHTLSKQGRQNYDSDLMMLIEPKTNNYEIESSPKKSFISTQEKGSPSSVDLQKKISQDNKLGLDLLKSLDGTDNLSNINYENSS